MSDRAAGTYAEDRYRQGLRNYRRRMRPYFIGLLAGGVFSFAVVYVTHGLDWWSFTAGAAVAGFVFLALCVHDEPPEVVAKWGRGAEGERMTARAVAPLLREGWKMRHDVDLGRGNADHLLLRPDGVAFVVETKSLAGQVTLERGVLVRRFPDDPGEIRRLDVRLQMQRVTADIKAKWEATGRPVPAFCPLVVIWGSYEQRCISIDGISFVSGDGLLSFLRES